MEAPGAQIMQQRSHLDLWRGCSMGSWDGVCGYHAPPTHTHKGKAGVATGILTHCRAESTGLQLNHENLLPATQDCRQL